MDSLESLKGALEKIILDPQYHAPLTLLKAVRNGAVYGTKVRFPHALVMIFLFRSAPLKEKLRLVFKATRQHARNLALFALVYKSALLALSHGRASGVFIPRGKGTAMGMSAKEGQYDTFVAGLVGGYTVFGRGIQSSVNQQIVIYVFARVVLALAKLAVSPPSNELLGGSYGPGGLGIGGRGERADAIRELVRRNSWPVFASLSWAMVMYLFRWHSDTLQPSLRSSMNYIFVDSARNMAAPMLPTPSLI